VKDEYPDFTITEVAKELGRRWATLDPAIKQNYEQRYQDSRKEYESALTAYKPQKKKKDPNAPKQPLSAYFLFSQEERLKVKNENPSFSICEVAKELGRRWAEMAPEVKQRYQQMAEEGRQKYDQDMASYRQAGFGSPDGSLTTTSTGTAVSQAGTTYTVSMEYGNPM
jgi:high mobility group protein B1